MAVDIGGITLTAGTNTLTILNRNNHVWAWNASGVMQVNNQPACQIGSWQGSQYPAYTLLPTGWQVVPFTGGETDNRAGICQGDRFYAPVTGMYLLTAQAYMYQGTANSDYLHPLFAINGYYGGSSSKSGSVSTAYRIRHYGIPNAAYFDIQISDLKYLTVGDYAELTIYNSASAYTAQIGMYHTFFAIALLG